MWENGSGDGDFHRLVDCIYESALDVSAMPAALDLFARYTHTDSPRYVVWDKLAGHARLGVTPSGCFSVHGSRVPDSLQALTAGPTSSPAHALARIADGEGTPESHAALAPSEAVADAGSANGGADLEQGICLLDTPEICVLMSGMRRSSDDINDTSRHNRLSFVMPHWSRAARLQQRNFELSGMAALGLASLDTLDFGVMVLQGDLRVRYANSWAESLVQADSHLALENGVLRAHGEASQATLRKLLDRAVRRPGTDSAAGSWMHITSSGQPVPIIVMPLVSRQPAEGPWQLPFAMLLMGNSESRSVLDAAMLASLFGLSRKESIVAARLAAGETLNEIAEREFLSPHTVRVHIRDILRKTGTHRQSELVRLLHLLPGVALDRAGGVGSAESTPKSRG